MHFYYENNVDDNSVTRPLKSYGVALSAIWLQRDRVAELFPEIYRPLLLEVLGHVRLVWPKHDAWVFVEDNMLVENTAFNRRRGIWQRWGVHQLGLGTKHYEVQSESGEGFLERAARLLSNETDIVSAVDGFTIGRNWHIALLPPGNDSVVELLVNAGWESQLDLPPVELVTQIAARGGAICFAFGQFDDGFAVAGLVGSDAMAALKST